MSQTIDFGTDGVSYGLLYPDGKRWSMSFYTTESGRKKGAKYLHGLGLVPLLTFELTSKEILQRAQLFTLIPKTDQRVRHFLANELIKVQGTSNENRKIGD